MMILNIAYYTIVRNIRDVKSMANMMLMPIILILILGNALSGVFEINSIGKTAIAYVNNDKGAAAESFERFLAQEQIEEMLAVQPVPTYEKALELLGEKKVSAIILLDEGLSKKMHAGQKTNIKIYEDINNKFRSSLVKNIIESYVNGANTQMAKMSTGMPPSEYSYSNMLEDVPLSAKGKIPGAMDYYAVTMLVLIVLYGSLYALHGIADDYLEGMGSRLRSTPVPVQIHFAGKILGTIATVFLQTILLVAFTKYVYGAYWGTNVAEIIFIAFTLSVFSVSVGLAAVMLIKDKKVSNAIIQTLIPVTTFISGGYMRIVSDNPLYNAVKFFMPSNLAHTAFFNSIYGEFAGQTVSSILILWIMAGLLFTVAVIAGRRRLA